MANVRRTIPVDFQTARELSVNALLAHIKEAHGLNSAYVTVYLQGRKIRSAEVLKKELRVGDTIWLSGDHLLGGKKGSPRGHDPDDNFQPANTMTQTHGTNAAFENDTK